VADVAAVPEAAEAAAVAGFLVVRLAPGAGAAFCAAAWTASRLRFFNLSFRRWRRRRSSRSFSLIVPLKTLRGSWPRSAV
jgi:hypothetical protein